MQPFHLPLTTMARRSAPAAMRGRRTLRFLAIAACALAALSATSHLVVRLSERAELNRLETDLRRRKLPLRRPLRVLTLGGSVTWGARLDDRDRETYASRIRVLHPDNVVDNLAIRATGARYPSTCIQSMIRDARGGKDDVTYDVIVMEFTLNGINGLDLLTKRLRLRYPDALFVYVNLYSLRNVGEDEHRHFLKHWKVQYDEVLEAMAEDPKFHVYTYPVPSRKEYLPSFLPWFASDEHHLNQIGHMKIANSILNIIEEANPQGVPEAPRLGSWGAGDRCYNWFMTGTAPDDLTFSGGEMTEFDPWGRKFGYEVPFDGHATIEFDLPMTPSYQESMSNEDGSFEGEPVYLNYMSKGDPSYYPKTQLTVVPESQSLADAASKTIELDPFNAEFSSYHVSVSGMAGHAIPGMKNTVHIVPQETTEWPLRIESFTMCGACREMGFAELTKGTAGGVAP